MDAFIDDKSKYLCIIMEFAEKGDLNSLIKTYKEKKTEIPEEKNLECNKVRSEGVKGFT